MTQKLDTKIKVSKTNKKIAKNRIFENQKSELKSLAIEAWKRGASMAEIAENLNRSRTTIYNWLRDADQMLSQSRKRSRLKVDVLTKSRVLELYVLFQRPSCRDLSLALRLFFSIQLSPSQLSRYLKRWGYDLFRPSPFYKSLRRAKNLRELLNSSRDASIDKGSALKWLANFERQASLNLQNEGEGSSEEDL